MLGGTALPRALGGHITSWCGAVAGRKCRIFPLLFLSGVILVFRHPDGVLLLILVVSFPLLFLILLLSSSAVSPGESQLQVSSSLRQHGGRCGFQLLIASVSKDLASSKSRIVASYVCLSKPADLDIPSPLITSSCLVAASKKAKLGTSSCCKQPNVASCWLDACELLKVRGCSVLGSVSCGTCLGVGSNQAARALFWRVYTRVTPTSPALLESFPVKSRAGCFKGKPSSPVTDGQRGNS